MKRLERLRRRIFLHRLPGILLTLLPGLVLVAAVSPALWQLALGPRDLYAMAPEELNGSYAAAHIDTIWDWYADTVSAGRKGGENVTSREYLVPLSDGRTFIGVQVPASLIPEGDQVLEETRRWRSDPDSYLWDGSSLTVRGTIRPMDEETSTLYASFLQESYGLTPEELDNFLPLVLVHGEVNGLNGMELLLLGLGAIAFLALAVGQCTRALRAALFLQIDRYCDACPCPEEALAQVEQAWEREWPLYRLRTGRDWLVYEDGADSWALRTPDAAWVYICQIIRGGSGWEVSLFSRSEPTDRHRHEVRVATEAQALQVVERLRAVLPDAVFGYSPDRDREYHRDPTRFGRETDPDRQLWEVPLPRE